MHCQIDFAPSALKQLRALPKNARRLTGAKPDRAQHDLTGDIKKLKGFKNTYRLGADIDKAAWSSLYPTVSRPFEQLKTGKIAIKVIYHCGDEVLKVFEVDK